MSSTAEKITPRIEQLPQKKLVGVHLKMSLAQQKTLQLWQTFMPKRNEIANRIGNDLYSVQVFEETFDFKDFTPSTVFERWAAAEVSDFGKMPEGFEHFTLQGGLYAVFLHKGPPDAFPKTAEYIFGTWLPASDYSLDQRPHFEILGEKYRHNQADSEEEIWIPIRPKP